MIHMQNQACHRIVCHRRLGSSNLSCNDSLATMWPVALIQCCLGRLCRWFAQPAATHKYSPIHQSSSVTSLSAMDDELQITGAESGKQPYCPQPISPHVSPPCSHTACAQASSWYEVEAQKVQPRGHSSVKLVE